MTTTLYDELKQFLGGYFHQDWDAEFSTSDEAVNHYLESHPPEEEIEKLIGQLNTLAGCKAENSALEHFLFTDLNCDSSPSGAGLTASEWLTHLSNLLEKGRR